MAKRKSQRQLQGEVELNYKQLARQRHEKKQRQRVLVAVGVFSAVIVTILLVAIISEFVVKPGQPVAAVDSVEISTKRFQERVRLERALIIDRFLQFSDLFGVEQAYSFSGVAQLSEPELIGEQVLNSLVEEVLVRKGADDMGIQISEDELWIFMEEREGFYREGTPTPMPTSTPRPTATPITPTDVIPTPFPSATALPLPTVVTEDAFQDLYQEQLRSWQVIGVGEDTYRETIEVYLLTTKVRDRLIEEVPSKADQVEFDALFFLTRDEADQYLVQLDSGEISFKELLDDLRVNLDDDIDARSISWLPADELATNYGAAIVGVVFSLEIGEYSGVMQTGDERFVLLQVTGHEERELSDSSLQAQGDALFSAWLEELREGADILKYDLWMDRVPADPELDPRLLVPTPSPAL